MKQTQIAQAANAEGMAQHASRVASLTLANQVGALRAIKSMRDTFDAGYWTQIQKIKETKSYKDVEVLLDNGSVITVGNFSDFCKYALGASDDTINDGLKNLEAFGELALIGMDRMGINKSRLNAMRHLPPDAQAILVEHAENVDLSNPDEAKDTFLMLLDEQAKRHGKVVDKKDQEIQKLNRENEANQKLIQAKNQRIDEMQRREHEGLGLSAAERMKAIAKISTHFMLEVAKFTKGIGDLLENIEATQEEVDFGNETVRFVFQEVASISASNGIAVSFEEIVNPPWFAPDHGEDVQE